MFESTKQEKNPYIPILDGRQIDPYIILYVFFYAFLMIVYSGYWSLYSIEILGYLHYMWFPKIVVPHFHHSFYSHRSSIDNKPSIWGTIVGNLQWYPHFVCGNHVRHLEHEEVRRVRPPTVTVQYLGDFFGATFNILWDFLGQHYGDLMGICNFNVAKTWNIKNFMGNQQRRYKTNYTMEQ
jgi:hypothetical protein